MLPPFNQCRLSSFVVVALLALPTLSAHAALVTYNFTGTITTLNDPTNILGGQVHLGDSYSGSLVYDTSTTATNPTATRAAYSYQPTFTKNYIPPIGITAQAGTFSVKPDYFYDDMLVQIFNNAPTNLGTVADGFIASQDYNGPAGLYRSVVELDDTTAAVFSSVALPASLNTAAFNLGSFSYDTFQSNGVALVSVPLFSGTINGLSTNAAVPEPTSMVLVGFGLMGIGAWRRSAGRHQAA